MKKLLLALATLLSLHTAALAQVTTLVGYNFDNLVNNSSANVPSTLSPCVTATNLTLNGLNQSFHTTGGVGNSKFRCFSGWDTTYDYSLIRGNLAQYADTLAFNMTVNPGDMVSISNLSLAWKRPFTNSVTGLKASIFWADDNGIIQHRTSNNLTLAGTGVWNSAVFDFTTGSAAFPTGSASSNETFHVELYAWGSAGNILFLDNIALNGTCSPVPEPSGALLLGSASFILLRRRTRK
ncbi:MAG: hypothetical protein IPK32_02895 [Verrucomicrobiaceae bacterium]|nr:hypothetical protein [Verrucomicrobiaceae bacterium]